MVGRIVPGSFDKGIVAVYELTDILAERFDVVFQTDRCSLALCGTDPVQIELICFLQREVVGVSAPLDSVDDKFSVGWRSGDLADAEIIDRAGSFAGTVIRYGENVIPAADGAVCGRGQAQRCLRSVRGFCDRGFDTDAGAVNQSRELLLNRAVRIAFRDIILELITHVVDIDVKGIGICGQLHRICRQEGSVIDLRRSERLDLYLKGRNCGIVLRGTDILCTDDVLITGCRHFLIKELVILESAEGSDRMMQFSGAFLEIHGKCLGRPVDIQQIQRSFLIHLDNGIIDAAQFALLMRIVLGHGAARIRGQIMIVDIVQCHHICHKTAPPFFLEMICTKEKSVFPWPAITLYII